MMSCGLMYWSLSWPTASLQDSSILTLQDGSFQWSSQHPWFWILCLLWWAEDYCAYRIVRTISPWAIFFTSALNRGVSLEYVLSLYRIVCNISPRCIISPPPLSSKFLHGYRTLIYVYSYISSVRIISTPFKAEDRPWRPYVILCKHFHMHV